VSALIRVVLPQHEFQIEPGQKGELLVTVQNLSEIVDQYSVQVDGLAPSWYTIAIAEVSLFPQDQERVRIALHPPSGAEARAGTYDFTVRVTSRENPTERTSVPASLEVLSTLALEVGLSPQQTSSTGDGVFQVRLANPSNTDLAVDLSATDPEEGCEYRFEPSRVSVGAGQSKGASLVVRPKQKPPRGEARRYDFTVKAIPTTAPTEAQAVTGILEHRSGLPRWVITAVVIAAMLLCCGAASFAGLQLFGQDLQGLLAGLGRAPATPQDDVPATQTAEAALAQAALVATQTAQAEGLAATQTAMAGADAATQTAAAMSMAATQTAQAVATLTAEAEVEPSSVPTDVPTPTTVPTEEPAGTPTHTATPAPSPTPPPPPTEGPTPTPTPVLTPCPLVPAGVFAGAWTWGETRQHIGCPTNSGSVMWTAEELFQTGIMVWRQDTAHIYAIYDDFTWDEFVDTWQEGDPEFPCPEVSPSASPPTPKRGFGTVWCAHPGVRDKLGEAVNQEQGGERWVQDFESGVMYASDHIGNAVLFSDGTWQ
jgi:hypothetical protein